jgi:multidrug resistance protein, MATE family
MTDRRHWPELLRLGWPVSATLLVRVTMRTVDLLVVGLVVGASGVAALGIGDAAARIVLMTALGLGAGSIATVSQHTGAGRQRDADIAATQTAVIAAGVGLPFAVLGWFGAPAFFRLLGAAPEVADLGVGYLRIVILSAPARTLAIMLTRALQGAGDTRTPMVIRVIGTALNIGLTLSLVPGAGPLPELGVTGAAIGTALGNVASAAILVGWLAHGGSALGFRPEGLTAFGVGRTIVRIGLPQVAERNLFALGIIPLNAMTLVFGTAANAGFQIGRRVMLYALLPSRGVATAASTRVGNAVGAGHPEDGDARARSAVSLALLISLPVAVGLFVWAEPVARLFVREADALAMAGEWVRVYAVATVLRAVYGVLRGALQGAGDTRPPLVAGVVGVAGFTVGFSWLVGIVLGVGLVGIYLGVLLDALVRTAILFRVFLAGRWLERSAIEPAVAGQA